MNKTLKSQHLNIGPYDIFILALTVLSILALLVLALPYFDTAAQQIALTLDLILSILFMIDFIYTLLTISDKRAYLKWGWIDFLGSLPYLPLLRILRIFRAIRSLRVLRQNNLQDIWHMIKDRPERTTVLGTILFGLILMSISSYAILKVELLSPDSNIQTTGDALWWSIVTITTVGYGDRFPTTNGGRIVAIVLMLMGIGFFSTLTSYLSASFINQDKQKYNDIKAQLVAIEKQLQQLKEVIKEQPGDDE